MADSFWKNNRLFEVNPWKIIETKLHIEKNECTESIFSLANEYMGVRGSFEEGFDGSSFDGCYIAGIYNKERAVYEWKRQGFPTYSNTMMSLTNWFRTYIEVDGELFILPNSKFSDYRRELDMKNGLLTRTLCFETKKGLKTALSWERFVSFDDKHLAAGRFTVKALNHDKNITVRILLDAEKENAYHSNSFRHTNSLLHQAKDSSAQLLRQINTTGQFFIHDMQVNAVLPDGCEPKYLNSDICVGLEYTFAPKKDHLYSFDRLVSVWTSRDAGYPFGLIEKETDSTEIEPKKLQQVIDFIKEKSQQDVEKYSSVSYDQVKNSHTEKVSKTWDHLDITIEGDESSQQGIRYCMFQLFNTYRGLDPHLNISAKGMTGEWYFGRYFWDSEAYCLPYYLFTNPQAARNLIECRFNTLDKARQRASVFNYEGGMYGWQTLDGSEDCGVWEYVFGETHINAIVPYAIYNYTRVTGKKDYLYERGIEVLIEMSRFWASRVSYIPYRHGFGILKCMGPDEYEQVIDNNYYTNYMSQWTLQYTLDTIKEMKDKSPENLKRVFGKISFDETEKEKWQKIIDGMILTYDEKYKIFVENDSFLSLEPAYREDLVKERDMPLEQKWTNEKFQRRDLMKQPDILMMMFNFRDKFADQQVADNYRFYEQRTVHGSSLSPSIHSIFANQVERYYQAYEYYQYASRLDLDDYNNNTREGLHISSMSGTWVNVVFGFGGLMMSDNGLVIAPKLPAAWDSLSFKFVYRDNVISVKTGHDKVELVLDASIQGSVPAVVYGQALNITQKLITVDVPESIRVENRNQLKAIIFDLDGVICKTDHFHYVAWKAIADKEGIEFDECVNMRLRGVSRVDSVKIIVEKADRKYSEERLNKLACEKNNIYVKMLDNLTPDDVLDGIEDFIKALKKAEIKIAVYSVSKNTDKILEKLGIRNWFDEIVTGNDITRSKPDPEGFVIAVKRLGIDCRNCLVIEDAFVGVEGAAAAGMKTIGIGYKLDLYNADYVMRTTAHLNVPRAKMLF